MLKISKYLCKKCKKIIIKDIEKYLKDYPDEKYIQCPYCGRYILVENIKMDVF